MGFRTLAIGMESRIQVLLTKVGIQYLGSRICGVESGIQEVNVNQVVQSKVKIGSSIERNDSRICLTLFLCKKAIYMQPLHVVGLLLSHLSFIFVIFYSPLPQRKKKWSSGRRKRNYYPQSWNTVKKVLSYLLSFVQRRQIAALGLVLPLQGSLLPPISTNIVGSLLIEQ